MKQILIAAVLLATPTHADTCGVAAALADAGRELPRDLSVRPRDREMIGGYGLTLTNGLLGAKFVRSADVLAALDATSCDAVLLDWLVTTAPRIQTRSGGGSDEGGGCNGSCGDD